MLNRWKKEVKKQNNSAGYIAMPASEIGKQWIVMTEAELELLLGRKLKND